MANAGLIAYASRMMKMHKVFAGIAVAVTLCGCGPKPGQPDKDGPKLTGPSSWTPFRSESGQWGFKGSGGATALEARFDAVMPFSEDRARVRMNGKYGFIDPTGQLAVPAEYDSARSFSDGRAVVTLGEKHGYVDPDGKVAIEIKYEYADRFANGGRNRHAGRQTGLRRSDRKVHRRKESLRRGRRFRRRRF